MLRISAILSSFPLTCPPLRGGERSEGKARNLCQERGGHLSVPEALTSHKEPSSWLYLSLPLP